MTIKKMLILWSS